MRVHILARELSVSSKAIVEKCHAEGVDTIKNHMSTLSAGLEATIREWFSEGTHDTTVEVATRVDLEKVHVKRRSLKKKTATEVGETDGEGADVTTATAVAEAETDVETTAPLVEASVAGASASVVTDAPGSETPSTMDEPVVAPALADDATTAVQTAAQAPTEPDIIVAPGQLSEDGSTTVAASVEETQKGTDIPGTDAADTSTPGSGTGTGDEPSATDGEAGAPAEQVKPTAPAHVPEPAKLKGPRVVRYEPIEPSAAPPRRGVPRPRYQPAARTGVDPARGPAPGQPAPGQPPAPGQTDRGARRRGRGAAKRGADRPGGGDGAAQRGRRDRDWAERQERLAGATGRRIHRRRVAHHGGGGGGLLEPAGPKTEATVNEPVRMKDFCSATGLSFMQLIKVLRDELNMVANINMTLPTDTAQLLALHHGIELTVIPAKTKLDEIKEEFAAHERKHLQTRPPVVTMLGHVDHGKTSLLDAIRRTRVASREDGGITQHMGAHHVDTPHGKVTFLDTPGHEAFTAMRARGAQVTDVVVLVVAADDGMMPQTIEAVNHAKAADVAIVVALNKCDLGDQNKIKIFGQLSEHALTPSGDWGGDTDVIETSATTGVGVVELVDHLSDLSQVLDLTADHTLPAMGTVLEAETKPGVGAVARVLIQEGTLRVGAFVTCGNASGKVRALHDDRGQAIKEAGPSIPVEVWGLDDVPMSGDKLFQLTSLQRAKDVAAEIKHSRVEENRRRSRKLLSLEELLKQRDSDEAPELNVIIKADVDGSLMALRQILEEIPSDEVRLALRHLGVGAVNDSDVLLAATCKGMIVAFRVEASVGAKRLAEQHGVEVRPYRVIYDVRDDIKKALEGLLAPEERPETRGSAEVREVFHLSKGKGIVAGSFVTDGTLDRSHLIKVVRDGVLVREGCRIASLRRFKDDVKEVRSGMECGIKLEGFDDLHVGDRVEAYEILKIARTL